MQNLIERFSEKNRTMDAKFFRVKFKRSVAVPDDFGTMTASNIDEIRDIPESLASTIGDSAEIIGEVVNGRLLERRRRVDPTAGIPPALSAPASFKALPPEFSELFHAEEKAKHAQARRDAWKGFRERLDANNPDRRFYDRKLDTAIAEVASIDYDKIAKLQLKVSTLTIQATNDANDLRDETERLAFEAFALRAHGLGLEHWQLERAFSGSALRRHFVRDKLGLTGLRQAFIGSQMHHYLDLGLVQTAWYYERAARAKAEFEALRAEVKKEVATAKKTFGKELVAA